MKNPKFGFILSMLALSSSFCLWREAPQSKPRAAEEDNIRIGSPFKGGIVVEAAEKFKEMVEKGSGGRIEVQIDAGTKSEDAICKANRTGEIEMQSNGTFPARLRPPVLLLHWSLRHEGLRSLHARLER